MVRPFDEGSTPAGPVRGAPESCPAGRPWPSYGLGCNCPTLGPAPIASRNIGGMAHPLIIGISGASGAPYAVRLLEVLRRLGVPAHVVISKSAGLALKQETGRSVEEVRELAALYYSNSDLAAPISSGSFPTLGMIVIPCSIRTLSDIAFGTTDTLVSRAADVVLKERRRLVLVVRETPLHAGHLRSMLAATENGAIIMPPVPAFYHKPKTIEDIVDQTVGRCLDLFGIDAGLVKRWPADA
jgi:flavin prenyltransferase